jgi:predicted DNA-binding transcriptional regulator YafY
MRDTQAATTDRFELPPDFAIDDYFQGEFGIWKSTERYKVIIDFDAQAVEYIRMRRVHPTQKLAATGNGVRLTMTVGNLTQLTSWVLEWGQRARVVEPPELVERVRTELENALKGYKKKQ